MKPLRILIISNYFPPWHLGGYEELCSEVAERMRQRGHQVFILTSNYGVNHNHQAETNIYRLLHEDMDIRSYLSSLRFFIGRQQRMKENLATLEKTVAETKPDVLFIWGAWNITRQVLALAEAIESAKLVYYIADYWPTLPDANRQHWQGGGRRLITRLPYFLMGKLALFIQSREDTAPALKFKNTICVSQAVRDTLLSEGVPIEDSQIIYNGIDLTQFNRNTNIREIRSDRPLSLLYAGRLSPEKGVDTAIKATHILVSKGRSVHLTIVGKGTPKCTHDLHQLSSDLELGGEITFRDYISREEMPHLFADHDVLLVPSKWADPLPRIIQEGMASGIVVVGSAVGGIPEILVNEVNGLLFDPDDVDRLTSQVERLAVSPELYNALSMAGRRTIQEKFDIQRTVAEIEDYLSRVVTKIE
jgi:glycosyltransferase involved in cell wall biosynthesis